MNKHGDKYTNAEYFLWAETIVSVKGIYCNKQLYYHSSVPRSNLLFSRLTVYCMYIRYLPGKRVHESMETPPDIPPFMERKVKRRKPASASTAGETFVQLAEAVTSALTGAHRSETRNQESSTNVSKLCFTISHVLLNKFVLIFSLTS